MWKVSVGFNAEEETVNFGARQVAVSEQSVYETSTLATILSTNECSEFDHNYFSCTKINGPTAGILSVINETIIYVNSEGSELLINYSFEDVVDCYSITQNGFALFIALRNGHLYYQPLIGEQKEPVLLKAVCNQNVQNEKTFLKIIVNEDEMFWNITLISCSGTIYRVKNMVIQDKMDKETVYDLFNDAAFDYLSIKENDYEVQRVIAAVELVTMGEIQILLLIQKQDNQILQLFSREWASTYVSPVPNKFLLEDLRVVSDGRLIYGLTCKSTIMVICSYTLAFLQHREDLRFEQYEIMVDEDVDHRMMVLANTESQWAIQLRALPDMSIKFQIKINDRCYLAKNQCYLDDLVYMEILSKSGQPSDRREMGLNLKMISESQPIDRLERMLRRGKFVESECFARAFNLSVESVYKAHLQKVLADLQPWVLKDKDVPLFEDNIKLFKELLHKVEDIEFVARCALNVVSSDFELMKNALKYAETCLETQISSNKAKGITILQELFHKVRNTLLRLDTFKVISTKPYIVDHWVTFQKTNLIEECIRFLEKGEIIKVMSIWGRHMHEFREKLVLVDAVSMFTIIPSTVPLNSVITWLEILLPTIVRLFPEINYNLMKWCFEKVSEMEMVGEENWIRNAIGFLKNIVGLLQTYAQMNLILSQHATDAPIQKLVHRIRILSELSTMGERHQLYLSIQEYTETIDRDLMFLVLDKTPIDELKSFVCGYFQTLVKKRKLHSNIILPQYIKNLIEESGGWWYWEEAPWETRVDILLSCIDDIQTLLNSVLLVLKNSPVPWSPGITKICNEALQYDHALTKLIMEQKRMVDCKIVLKKYDLKDISIIQSNFDRVINYLLLQDRENVLEDALLIANTINVNLCKNVYKAYIKYLIEFKNPEDALYFLDDPTLPIEMVITCCECVIYQASCLREKSVAMDKFNRYVQVLVPLRNILACAQAKILGKPVDPFDEEAIPLHLCEQIKKYHFLRTNYGQLELKNYSHSNKKRSQLLNTCLYSVLEQVIDDESVSRNLDVKILELAKCFDLSHAEVSIRILRLAILKEVPSVVSKILNILWRQHDFKKVAAEKFIDISVFILISCLNKNEYISEHDITSLVHPLLIKALNCCPTRLLNRALEVKNWMFILQQQKLQYSENNLVDIGSLVRSNHHLNYKVILNLIIGFGIVLSKNNLKTEIDYPSDDEELKINELMDNMRFMMESEDEYAAFGVITVLNFHILHSCAKYQRNLNELPIINEWKSLASTCLIRLLNKLIGSRYLNPELGSTILHHFKVSEGSKWIKESTKRYKLDYNRLHALTELGLLYFEQNLCDEDWRWMQVLKKQCTWGKKITEYGISYKEAFRVSIEEKKQLLMKLISSVDTETLKKFCFDMEFDFQACLKVYLRQLLLAWKPEYTVHNDPVTVNNEVVLTNSQAELLNKCKSIVKLVENKKELLDLIINRLWDTINYYYYEVYLVLLTIMEELSVTDATTTIFSTYRNVIIFLSSYQRISKPTEYELEQWNILYENGQTFPNIAEYRLPFKLLFAKWTKGTTDPWKIIKPELSLRTYTKWFVVLDSLGLDKDLLCTFTINQMTESIGKKKNNEWCTHLRHQELLSDVQRCIEHISSLEMVSVSLFYVMNHLPPGADQVTAAKLCYLHSKKWYECDKNEKAKDGFLRCQKKYLVVSVTHILHTHNLGKSEFLQLVYKPTELINALYNDPVILQWCSQESVDFPDINKAAEEISVLYKEDIFKIRLGLLEEWLLPEDFMADVSYDGTIVKIDEDRLSSVDNDNFLKICYVVQSDLTSFSSYLLNIALEKNLEDCKPISVRLRALQCLLSVSSPDRVENIVQLQEYMSNLQFVYELEVIGYSFTITAFNACDKSDIVKPLLSLKSSKAIVLATRILLHFQITTPAIWNIILKILCDMKLGQELMTFLPQMTAFYHILDFMVFKQAWNFVLLDPLNRASDGLCKEEKKKLAAILKLIYICPIIDQLDIETIQESCERIGIDFTFNSSLSSEM